MSSTLPTEQSGAARISFDWSFSGKIRTKEYTRTVTISSTDDETNTQLAHYKVNTRIVRWETTLWSDSLPAVTQSSLACQIKHRARWVRSYFGHYNYDRLVILNPKFPHCESNGLSPEPLTFRTARWLISLTSHKSNPRSQVLHRGSRNFQVDGSQSALVTPCMHHYPP